MNATVVRRQDDRQWKRRRSNDAPSSGGATQSNVASSSSHKHSATSHPSQVGVPDHHHSVAALATSTYSSSAKQAAGGPSSESKRNGDMLQLGVGYTVSGGRASGEKRSRRGCRTCKTRRKKCPEDFVLRPDGSLSCSACLGKGLRCHAPSPTPTGEPGGAHMATNKSLGFAHTHTQSVASQMLPPQTMAATGINLLANQLPPSLGTFGQEPTRFSGQPALLQPSTQQAASHNTASAFAPVAPITDVALDSSWLDDFFKEFSSLSDPIYQDAMWLAHGNSANVPIRPTASAATTTISSNATSSAEQNSTSTPSSTPAWSASGDAGLTVPLTSTHMGARSQSQDYDRIVQSDELDSLLERYSPLYEKLWRAAFSVSQPDNGLTRAILALSRASKSCRAATVASCLSYHHVMQRERAANPRQSMGLSHFLLNESGQGAGMSQADLQTRADPDGPEATAQAMQWPTAEERVGMAYKWYQFAMEEYKRSGRMGTLEQRLATLLNLRWTIITLDGSNAGLFYMEEIRSLITEMGVTTGYMRHTARRGTVLTVLVQSVLATDVFESATKRYQRCALRPSPSSLTTPASIQPHATPTSTSDGGLNSELLTRDLQRGPLYDYEFTSCLSEDVIECIMMVSNLDADIHEGHLTDETERMTRRTDVETAIRNCRFVKKAELEGAAMLRAMALHEMWRQAVLLHFFQVIHGIGPLAAKMQHVLQQILSLANMLKATLTPSETWDMWMVWFLAATVAITAEQRAKCMHYLEALGSE